MQISCRMAMLWGSTGAAVVAVWSMGISTSWDILVPAALNAEGSSCTGRDMVENNIPLNIFVYAYLGVCYAVCMLPKPR